jgi:hypothetical protein
MTVPSGTGKRQVQHVIAEGDFYAKTCASVTRISG